MWLIFIAIICLIFLVCSQKQESEEFITGSLGPKAKQIVGVTLIPDRGPPISLSNNQTIHPVHASSAPEVSFKGKPGKKYTLVMIDPDAPNPDNPVAAEWRHWVVSNVPAGEVFSNQSVYQLSPYQPPDPPIGQHRYILKLYEQKAGSLYETNPWDVKIPEKRSNWDSEAFAIRWDLKKKGEFQFRAPIMP
jgi:hypothetical protein